MSEQPKGKCRHGDFLLTEGCPECIAERQAGDDDWRETKPLLTGPYIDLEGVTHNPYIVKVRYFSEKKQEESQNEYTYYSTDLLRIGDIVTVPVRDTTRKAKVTAVDVPESEIEDFMGRIKTIPSGSIIAGTASVPTDPPDYPETNRGPDFDFTTKEEPTPGPYDGPTTEVVLETEPEPGSMGAALATPVDKVFEEEAAPVEAQDWAKPPALVTIETRAGRPMSGLFQLYDEAVGLRRVAKERVIATNEDLTPATDDLSIIAVCKKAMTARKNEIVAPFKATLDAVNQAFADLMFPVVEADRLTREQVTGFENEQRRKIAEATRIEAEKLKLAQDEATLTGTGEHTQELGTAEGPPAVPERTRTGLGTLGGRDNWKARVFDFKLLSDEWKIANESLLNSHARTTKGSRPIPGVEFYNDRTVTMRTRKP